MSKGRTLFTIGHSNHPIERFIALLTRHGIEALADVRSTPYSRFNPQFNKSRLEASLKEAGIRYVFLGEELGARSKDPSHFEGGKMSYAKLAASAPFQQGLQRLLKGAGTMRVAMMCAEREPLDCHRTILVGRQAEKAGATVIHILADGALEENRHALERLEKRLKLPQDDLFASERDRHDAVYEKQGARIAPPSPDSGQR
jgi:uncharacterized protein (DUF488 family)